MRHATGIYVCQTWRIIRYLGSIIFIICEYVSILFLTFCVLLTMLLLCLHFYSLDGISGFILSMGKPENTYYAEGYTHKKFRRIMVGMSMAEVDCILGSPLFSVTNVGGHVEISNIYSDWSRKGDFRMRSIVFHNDIVFEVIHEYWVD